MTSFLGAFYFFLNNHKHFATIEIWFLFKVLKIWLTANGIYLQDLRHVIKSAFCNTVNTALNSSQNLHFK